MQKQINPNLETLFSSYGFVRVSDNEAGAKYVRGSDYLLVSGHFVFMSYMGMIRAFPEDKVPMLGIQMMERLTRMNPKAHSGKEDMTNYYMPMAKDQLA